MGPDEIAELEGEASALLTLGGQENDEAPRMIALCERIMGHVPQRARGLSVEACLVDGCRVLIRSNVPSPRARWLVGHELAEWWHLRTRYEGADIEERCDAMGAMLAAPRRAFQRAIRSAGRHAVHALALRFNVPQSLALLRVGEVTGRPVALLRQPEALYRGADFAWPSTSTLRRALEEGHSRVHPVSIVDEPNRVGLMARWGWDVG